MTRTSIRWDEVRARVKANEASLLAPLEGNSERMRSVLRARAVTLASEPAARHMASPGVPALVFRLGQDRYAIELQALAEVLPQTGCIAVPGARPEFAGVINLRGELRPVVNLARLLSRETSPTASFVLMSHRGIGFAVERVEGLLEVHREELTRPVEGRYYQGLASGNVMLLDIEALLSSVVAHKEY
jgi:purine-binding chemotaxis protein CheW